MEDQTSIRIAQAKERIAAQVARIDKLTKHLKYVSDTVDKVTVEREELIAQMEKDKAAD